MRLTVYLPTDTFINQEVDKVVAEGPHGSFCLLPRHVDYVVPLVPGILSYIDADTGQERFMALDGGILVKQRHSVAISTPKAVGGELGSLRSEVVRFLEVSDERNKASRSAVARLEAGFLKRFVTMSKDV